MQATPQQLLSSLFVSSLLLGGFACGESSPNAGADAGESGGADANTSQDPDAAVGDSVELITGTWSKAPGSDAYWCAWRTVQEDTYITSFEAIAPFGTHHTVVSVTDTYTGPDKEEACGVGTMADQLLYASGVGTNAYPLPEGIAVKVKAGQTIMLNLHLFNVGEETLTGTSGTRITTTTESEVTDLAEFFFAGTYVFQVPDNGTDYSASGSCTLDADSTVFTLWPHMHQVGKHMDVTHNGNSLLNEEFSFEEQKMYPITPVEMAAGEKINVSCTWNNPQGNGVKRFGDNSTDEMCFAGVYRYPARGIGGFCVDGFSAQ